MKTNSELNELNQTNLITRKNSFYSKFVVVFLDGGGA